MKPSSGHSKQIDVATDVYSYNIQPTVIRHQANARERYRTHSVNSAFVSLRELIPTEPKTRKLSKIETLRLAKSYIEHLAAMLITGRAIQPCLHVEQQNYDEYGQSNFRSRNICTFCAATKGHDDGTH